HRYGRLAPGDNIVLVVTASAHRAAAFAAADFLMDYLKTRAPFWKQEERAGGAAWVAAKDADEAAAGRWEQPSKRRAAGEGARRGSVVVEQGSACRDPDHDFDCGDCVRPGDCAGARSRGQLLSIAAQRLSA